MSLSLGRNETAAELHQNLTDGEVVRIEKDLMGEQNTGWADRKQNYHQALATNKKKKHHKTRRCTGIVYSTLLPTLRILFTLQ